RPTPAWPRTRRESVARWRRDQGSRRAAPRRRHRLHRPSRAPETACPPHRRGWLSNDSSFTFQVAAPKPSGPLIPQLPFLPELDQYAVGAARRDERRLPAVAEVFPVDDADAVGGELREQRVEPVDVDGNVMQPFAATLEEARHEARRAPRLDQLD